MSLTLRMNLFNASTDGCTKERSIFNRFVTYRDLSTYRYASNGVLKIIIHGKKIFQLPVGYISPLSRDIQAVNGRASQLQHRSFFTSNNQ